ncbi:response regulator, partial [bacterium]
ANRRQRMKTDWKELERKEAMGKRSLKILLVDNDRDILDVLGMLLEMDGAQVAFAESYYEALDKLDGDNFDIVVTDWRMPRMHGLYLLDMIKDTMPKMPVIIMTAYLSDEIRTEAKRRKVDLMLEKPFEYQDLHSGIVRLVKK